MAKYFGWGWLACWLLTGSAAFGQISARGLIGPEQLAPLGLQMAWSTQIEVDRGSDRVVGVTQHVSYKELQTIYEFTFDNKLYTVSERDRDAFGAILGPEGAKRKVDQIWEQIKLEYEFRGLKEPEAPLIMQRVVPEITLYATTERGMIHAIDGNTGKTRWATSVGKSRYPTTTAGGSDKFVAVINGSTLYVLKAADGSFAWSRPIGGVATAGPAVSDQLVFVPRINGAVELYNVEDHRRPVAVYKALGAILVPPVTSYNSVAWPTDRGHLYVGFANQEIVRFRVEAKDGIIAQPFFTPSGRVLATSLDGYIYCIDEVRGDVIWRFTTGEPIDISPIAIDDTVYAITREHNLFAVNLYEPISEDPAKKGWVVSGIGGFLAGSENRLYCTDVSGNLVVLDAKSGARLGAIPTAGMTLKFPNLYTDRIFLGQTTGLLQCIRQSDLKYPLVHYHSEPGQKKRPAAPGAQPGQGAPMPPPNPVDPFADPAPAPNAADPFADPAPAAPMPDAPGAAQESDPFG